MKPSILKKKQWPQLKFKNCNNCQHSNTNEIYKSIQSHDNLYNIQTIVAPIGYLQKKKD